MCSLQFSIDSPAITYHKPLAVCEGNLWHVHYHDNLINMICTCTCTPPKSTGPFPPSSIEISQVTSSSLLLSWTPTLPWQGYAVDYYNINITDSQFTDISVFTTNSTRFILEKYSSTIPCKLFHFRVSAVSVEYGESEASTITRGFDASEKMIV